MFADVFLTAVMVKSIVRTLVIAVVLAACAWFVYHEVTGMWNLRAIAERDRIIAEMNERLAQKDAMLERLARSERKGRIEIVGQSRDAAGRPLETDVRFIELDHRGSEIGRQEFTIEGGVLFVDAWTAKFGHEDVALGNPFRGRTLVLLRRFYSESTPPENGVRIDTPGGVPAGYAATDVADFEKRIWEQFWELATDPEAARRFGVRVAQGEVVYKPVRAGQRFDLSIDAAGGINLVPIAESETVADDPSSSA